MSKIPQDRFSLPRFEHPRRGERGKSYTFAAGVLDDIWGFDPAVFGISPREAQQMDPQQRILLELTWEALEDAGIVPSAIAGTEVGVFVGGSLSEYAHPMFGDPAVADCHFATGNASAILANRISYVFDLRGPSLTIDTACSSSLVALHQAVETIRNGQIETAIVAGINILAAPTSFISFSQASMLSPTGLCRAFSADADGYVRAEGGAVLVLRKLGHGRAAGNPVHGIIVASDVNSDGRTNGIALPSGQAQERLLRRIYDRAGISPVRLAFVEAHGTGTPAGDPIEAGALGRALGQCRTAPLPIGSIKTNIGHLEPASGLAGVIKSMLALNHGVLARSLHFSAPNPNIDFEALNLRVCREPLMLCGDRDHCAGVSSFGFGGTNAHAIVAAGFHEPSLAGAQPSTGLFSFSAASRPALRALAQKYLERIDGLSDEATAIVASAGVHRRDRLPHRLVITTTRQEAMSEALNAFVANGKHELLAVGEAIDADVAVAFVYSGNGSQWPGMGRSAYWANSDFRRRFDAIDEEFEALAGWSLRQAMLDEKLGEQLERTSIAQPLMYAVESAATAALRARGLHPLVVLGHSVGEVAAAEAAGILNLRSAVRVIYYRSTYQELVRGAGRMVAVLATRDVVEALTTAVSGVEIAAYNGPRALTVAGRADALAKFIHMARKEGVACLDLGLAYPFHTSLMGPVEAPLVKDLGGLTPQPGAVPMISTVTGGCVAGERFDAGYWWRNVRDPVRFATAVNEAARLGARLFVEIGPRGVLGKHISDVLAHETKSIVTLEALERDDARRGDTLSTAVASAMVAGAKLDVKAVAGPDPGATISLPSYPWQRTRFRYQASPEAIGWFEGRHHPLSGARYERDALEWHASIDTALIPELAEHRIGEEIILPGTGFLEIALSVASQWSGAECITLTDFETLTALNLSRGETREVLTRVSSGSRTLEILSRPRLSQASWILHARAKVVGAVEHDLIPSWQSSAVRETISGECLYRIAHASGLHYGPAFSSVQEVSVRENGMIDVELVPHAAATPYLLDPLRVDCCAQGLITLFPGLRTQERGVAYIPVRLDEVSLKSPGRVVQRAVIEPLSQNERSILANIYIFASDGAAIATLRGVRCQAVPVRRSTALEAIAFAETIELADGSILGDGGMPMSSHEVVTLAQALSLSRSTSASQNECTGLLQGWATMVAYEIAEALADDGLVDPDLLIAERRLAAEFHSWLIMLLARLEAAELASERHGTWLLHKDPLLPNSASIVKRLATRHPERAGELLVAAEITAIVERLVTERSLGTASAIQLSQLALDFYDLTAGSHKDASAVLIPLIRGISDRWPRDRAVRLLQFGNGPLAQEIAALDVGHLTLVEPRYFERVKLSLAGARSTRVIDQLDGGVYDLIIVADEPRRLFELVDFAGLRQKLAADGMLIAIGPKTSLFRELLFGLLSHTTEGASPLRMASAASGGWSLLLRAAGFEQIHIEDVTCGEDVASLIVAKAPAAKRRQAGSSSAELVRVLTNHLTAADALRNPETQSGEEARWWAPSAGGIVHVVPIDDGLGSIGALSRACLEIKACAERLGSVPTKLWLVFRGALAHSRGMVRPVQAGAWAFSRTVANEFPGLDVRRIDLAPDLSACEAATWIAEIIGSDSAESELQIDRSSIRTVRFEPVKQTAVRDGLLAPAARLERRPGSAQRLVWQPAVRRVPEANEVEIAVAATGLNFRDVMYMLGLLPDDILEDGLAGPTVGLECAGTIVAKGTSVTGPQVGDRVVAMAADAFSTHVTLSGDLVAKIPYGISFEAAATIPSAFVTAYYSLITLGQLKAGEWVLVHGGAGAVGMAAIQIAQGLGAKVIATAGAVPKRSLLRALGVPNVLDSRSTRFVEEVHAITGCGVDVVLNSLAGQAMERSMACLRPFGRFIELGKRDYVANTHIGLRPFRKNLSYFGVDVDQLLADRPHIGREVLTGIMGKIQQGALTCLPHCMFRAEAVLDAFQLMQQSGHVGKIIVRPPDPVKLPMPADAFRPDPEGTHVVTGGLGGFGLATAKWLAARGARHLVLIGRRGAVTEEAKDLIRELASQGVTVLAVACDIADGEAVEALFVRIRQTMPRLAGVIHSAMVLDDAILANLTAERLEGVLAPKVKGADHLDRATRGVALDYFVLYSSFVTLIGTRGQGSYVAANAYLEGLARRRRQQGLPALAIMWGPITDVGVVARTERMRSDLRKIGGLRGLSAQEALDLMGQALTFRTDEVEYAALSIAPHEGTFSSEILPVLKSPTYQRFVTTNHQCVDGLVERIDLRAILATVDIAQARQKVIDVVVARLAGVLLLRPDDVSCVRPLSDMGLDSLMAVELALALEESFGVHLPSSSLSGTQSVTSLADEVIALVVGEKALAQDAMAESIVAHHLEKGGPAEINIVSEMLRRETR